MKFFVRLVLAVLILALPAASPAQTLDSNPVALRGTIRDSLGAVIQNATVELVGIQGGEVLQTATTDTRGEYAFAIATQGRFRIRAQAGSFQPAESEEEFAAATHPAVIDLVLSPSMVARQIVVTATGVPTPEVQTGASIGVIGQQSLETRRDVEQELRLQPGAQVTSTGQIGSATALYVRGGPSNSSKVLIDGVPANDVSFRYFNFGNLNAEGFEKAELFRGPDSALYGSDALSGVLSLTTRRGVTPLPEVSYALDGGTYGTMHQESSLGGAWRRLDYFTDFARFDTQNSTPNSEFHNGSVLGNLGWQLFPGTELRATVRRSAAAFNSANALGLYGIPDDGVTRELDTSFGVTLENRPSERWHNLVRYSGLRFREPYVNFGPTGKCYDPGVPACNDGNQVYLGKYLPIRGANGYQVSGQAIFQFPGTFQSSLLSDRDSIYAQSDYRVNSHLAALFGFRYEAEGGYSYSNFDSPTFSFTRKVSRDRGNYSYMTQLSGGFGQRLYYTVGSGLENNAVFGFAATPRASLAYHLVRPSGQGLFSGTRLVFNFGKGILEPSIYQETNSVYNLLQSVGYSPANFNIHPFRAQLSRTYDGGVQQMLYHGRARLSITYFHNEFGDQAEAIPFSKLYLFGVKPGAIDALGNVQNAFSAYINSLSFRAQGAEVEAEYHITRKLAIRGGWTYTDAVVQHSFSGMLANAAYNPKFPTVAIGAYSPLNGARPFHIAPNTGYFSVDWNSPRWLLRMTGTLVSRRDDSDFLEFSDINFGNTLLLPNRNLDPAYQKLDLYGSFRITHRVSAYATMENLLNQHYYESFGFPALPFTVRSGMEFRFGGESWKL
jgi:vitamin B12 transporter